LKVDAELAEEEEDLRDGVGEGMGMLTGCWLEEGKGELA